MANKSKLPLITRLKWFRWSVQNWWKGYMFGPIQRFPCCGHTTPHHYGDCDG